jgi:hypothetical protein
MLRLKVLDESDQIVRWRHMGEEDGVSCRLYYYPKQNLDVVILGNQCWCAGSLAWEIHAGLSDGACRNQTLETTLPHWLIMIRSSSSDLDKFSDFP